MTDRGCPVRVIWRALPPNHREVLAMLVDDEEGSSDGFVATAANELLAANQDGPVIDDLLLRSPYPVRAHRDQDCSCE